MNAILDIGDVESAAAAAIANLDGAVREGLGKAAELVQDSAKRQHRYEDRSGDLTRSIDAEEVGGAFFAGGLIADVTADAPHAASIEKGSKAHVIRAKGAKALAFYAGGLAPGGTLTFRRSVNHPGTKARLFLAEALEREMPEATTLVFEGQLSAFEDAGFHVERG